MINPFLWLVLELLELYGLAVLIYVVLGLLIYFNIVNAYQPVVRKVNIVLGRAIEPVLKYIREIVPPLGSLDISPMILLLLLKFLQHFIVYYF
jgi:YggT family protein